jgi:uncharacterized protein (TIGR00290 family)
MVSQHRSHVISENAPKPRRPPKRAAVLWTGGKDSTLALCRAREAGLEIACFATFYPTGEEAPFKAHPLNALREVAAAADFEIDLIPVSPPYRAAYIKGLEDLRDRRLIDSVVTGDIDVVDGLPNWIGQCCEGLGLQTVMPLWQRARELLLREVIERGIVARISWINSPHIPQAWLGRIIDARFVTDIQSLAQHVNIDICGENGEYHTMVDYIP